MAPSPPPGRRGPARGAGIGDLPDLDGPARPRRTYPVVPIQRGMQVKQRGTPITGVVVDIVNGAVHVRDRQGFEHRMTLLPGGFEVDGEAVTLVVPRAKAAGGPGDEPSATSARTASGSIALPKAPARVARASRLLVEGVHDAELVEKVWGDDLRVEGVVVERLDGADHLAEAIRAFGPRPGRRVGILLDHLVAGSKEQRIAAEASGHSPDVLVTGHPFVDIWQAVKPAAAGISAWPDVPRGEDWKTGTLARLGIDAEPGRYWKHLLGRVTSWTDLEPPLIGAVEELIDFVTEPGG